MILIFLKRLADEAPNFARFKLRPVKATILFQLNYLGLIINSFLNFVRLKALTTKQRQVTLNT